MSKKPAKAIDVFYSYSHKDEELRDELEKHLSILKRRGVIQGWHDRKVGAGKEWKGEIDTHLNTANVILLLISPDFLASDYCYDVEMKRAMERHEAREARVIPVILRPVDWKDAPFGKLQALPTDAKPVTGWPDRDEAFLDVARGIRVAVEERAGPPVNPPSSVDTAGIDQKKVPISPPPAKPRRPVNWEKVGAIAGVIGVFIALGSWLVPNVLDWIFKAPTVTPTGGPIHAISTQEMQPTESSLLIPKTSISLTVQANIEWQNTRVVVEEGELVQITRISGKWRGAPGGAWKDGSGCAGSSPYDYPLPTARGGSLIAKVDDSDPVCVGTNLSLVSSHSGILYLTYNDCSDTCFHDNEGSLIVQIEVFEVGE